MKKADKQMTLWVIQLISDDVNKPTANDGVVGANLVTFSTQDADSSKMPFDRSLKQSIMELYRSSQYWSIAQSRDPVSDTARRTKTRHEISSLSL